MTKRMDLRVAFLVLWFAGWSGWAMAQTVIIKGRVLDKATEEGVPFANVYLSRTMQGSVADVDGNFEIHLPDCRAADTLVASAIGYVVEKKTIGRPLANMTMTFKLETSEFTLSEIVVVAGENPANAIVRNIIRHKDENRMERFEQFSCEAYTKTELDLTRLYPDDSLKDLPAEVRYVFEHLDTTSDQVDFLPLYLQESIDHIYYTKSGGGGIKEMPVAVKVSGVENSSFVDQVKRIHEAYNIYDNWIPILEKNFTSPLANSALFFYEFYIIDSAFIQEQWCYQLKFKPKRKQEYTFTGDFWVADTSFAIVQLNMRVSEGVNLNLVNRISIFEEYERNEKGLWLLEKQKYVTDFTVTPNTPGVISRRTRTFKKYQLNDPAIEKIYKESDPQTVQLLALEKSDAYWQQTRHESLSNTEANIYVMVDSIVKMPQYKTFSDVFYMLTTGYIKFKKVDIGPFGSFYSRNVVEGNRFRFGLATNKYLNPNYRAEVFVAYGLKDETWKYGGRFQWNIKGDPLRLIVGGSYLKDVVFTHNSTETAINSSNIFSTIFRRNVPYRLLETREAKLYFLKDYKKGITTRLSAINRFVDPCGNADGNGFEFKYLPDPADESHYDTTVTTTELMFTLRWAYKEEFFSTNFDRISTGSRYPILSLSYTLGAKGVLGSDYEYHRLDLRATHWFNISPIGWLQYRLYAGKVFGTLPSLLLEVHPGNQNYFYAPEVFNAMNQYEFTSDTYFGWIVNHHFEGLFFNKIPLLRRLKLREMVSFRGVWGTLTEANQAANKLNTSDVGGTVAFRAPSKKPYMEVSLGVENILKFFSLHGVWRLSYLDNPEAPRFTIIGGAYFYF